MGRSADYSKQKCALAGALDIVGEPWTMLILRDSFRGITRFEQWQESLGLARNVLASRLKSLVKNGVLEARVYCERPRRQEYILTQKGYDLRPTLLHLMDWGSKHVYGEESPDTELIHACGHRVSPQTHCAHCNTALQPYDITLRRIPEARAVGELKLVAEEA